MSNYIADALKCIFLPDSLSLSNSEELVSQLAPCHSSKVFCMSLDIKDSYFSLDSSLLMSRLRRALERDLVAFQTNAGIPISSFLELVTLYLSSTVVNFNGKPFTQSKGICIGSAIAPKLSEIYLSALDQALMSFPSTCSGQMLVLRYVDDIIVVATGSCSLPKLLAHAELTCPELVFTSEFPSDGSLRFLDLALFTLPQFCWEYGRSDPKPLLSRHGYHPKSVKSGVIKSVLPSAIKKSCAHKVATAVSRQMSRVMEAGFQQDTILKHLHDILSPARVDRSPPTSSRPVILPYFHGIRHALGKLSSSRGIRVALLHQEQTFHLNSFRQTSIK